MITRSILNILVVFLLLASASTGLQAQETNEDASIQDAAQQMSDIANQVESALPQAETDVVVPPKAPKILSMKDTVNPDQIPSLFFTPDALLLLKDAIKGLNTGSGEQVGDGSETEPGIRELSLGGIVFTKTGEWTIWLNGRRITPDTIPGEIFDLDVYKEYIDIKWYDAYTNRLFPVRLRTNERFNLDSRLFLTGAHSDDQQL